MIGGIVLHRGEIAGDAHRRGQDVVATLASYLNALPGKGVHVVTVNDYLARRDAEWMGRVHKFLGLSVGVIVPNLTNSSAATSMRRTAPTVRNNEFGFRLSARQHDVRTRPMVQRPFNFAIVTRSHDPDRRSAHARSSSRGPTDDKSELYLSVDALVKQL
jgi:preprotein translocase subunit SecA